MFTFQIFVCKILSHQLHGSAVFSAYIVTAMALDRLLAIKRPIWHKNNASTKAVNIVLIVLVLFSYGLVWSTLYFYHIDENGNCTTNGDLYTKIFYFYTFIGAFVFYFAIPICLLVFANAIFASSLFKRKSNKTSNAAGQNQ